MNRVIPVPIRRRQAFSLLELLLAVSIMTVIVASLYGMFYHVQRGLRANVTQVDVLEGARAAMDLLGRDFERTGPSDRFLGLNLTGRLNTAYSPVVQVLGDGTSTRTNLLEDVAALSRYNQKFTATAYRVLFAETGIGTLCRYDASAFPWEVDPALLVSNVLVTPIPGYATNNSAPFTPILDGVIHFRTTVHDAEGLEMSWWRTNILFQSGLYYGPEVRLQPDLLLQETRYGFLSNALPAYVEIELGVLEPRTLEQYRSFGSGSPLARKFLAEHSGQVHLFRQRVPIRLGAEMRAVNLP
ncbi:MAG: prepilin-type N-terminal cleavage/methylation domain-containing protein [Verrucomicrobiales bacterium]|nr:prepilin-type N-terminal cleavage/methylation domain-containing protein [Verrucomicrobiales bacterium]